ncbi:MAG: type VI secretion system protein TssA [Acidobacteriota bacterium]|jgi:type VI secretion system protein ImpA
MSDIDVEGLLQPVSEEAPCGEDVEYDPVFGEMVLAGTRKEEQQMGDAVVDAEEPDWRAVRTKGLELLGRTKDLRVATHLANALAHTEGYAGLDDGLALIRGMLERYWDTVHPQLDPEDNNDPIMRVNVLASLADAEGVLRGVRLAPLVSSRAMGRFSVRDVGVAAGKYPPAGGQPPPDTAVIDGAFQEAPLEDLQSTALAIDSSLEHLQGIESFLASTIGASSSPDLDALRDALGEARQVMADQLGRRGVATEGGADAAPSAGGAAAGPSLSGEIHTREDVIRALDKACDYFNRHEPSSPVPLLLQRAKRLISKNFLDILRDLAPDGVSQAQNATGVNPEESSSSWE